MTVSGWSEDEHTDPSCDHDWNPVSGAKEVCPLCGGVRAWVEHDDAVNALLLDLQTRIAAVRAEAERAQDGRGSWVHATRLLALIHDDPAERPTP